ncbi:MAG: Uma2 family endonuclease [Bacteroidetes bacterium]|nr:Uma2 family endonuclease [Bacteroidota bacterium]
MSIEILEKKEIREKISPITVSAYHIMYENGAIDENVELIEGVIVEKMPKKPIHSAIVARLNELIRNFLLPHLHIRQEQPITFLRSEPEPDLAVVKGNENDYLYSHPSKAEFIIEVALTSLALDREKIAIYAKAGIPEYWIINVKQKEIEVYSDLKKSQYIKKKIIHLNDMISFPFAPQKKISTNFIFFDND